MILEYTACADQINAAEILNVFWITWCLEPSNASWGSYEYSKLWSVASAVLCTRTSSLLCCMLVPLLHLLLASLFFIVLLSSICHQLFICCLFLFFQDRVFLYSPGCPETDSVDRPDWLWTQRSIYICLWSAGIKGMQHNCDWDQLFSYSFL